MITWKSEIWRPKNLKYFVDDFLMIYTFIFVCETIEPSMWNWSNSVKVKHSMKNPSSPWSFLLIGTYLLLLSPQRKVNTELPKTLKNFSRLIYCNLSFQENVVKRCWISAEKVKKPLTFFTKCFIFNVWIHFFMGY